MPSINLPDELYRRLFAWVQDFGETPADALRRVLDVAERTEEEHTDHAQENGKREHARADRPEIESRMSWLHSPGGHLPPGTQLRATYKSHEFEAHVERGKIVWNGEPYGSPTRAALAAIQSTGTDRIAENGWRFWGEAKLPWREDWIDMHRARNIAGQRYREQFRPNAPQEQMKQA